MRTGTAELATAPEAGGPKVMPNGVSPYAVVLPDDVKAFPEYLRKAGYYTTNNQKTDHQFEPPVTVWDDNGSEASYRNHPKGKPFFSVFNFFLTHDSQVAMRQDLLLADPAKVTVPPIYPDTPGGRAVADDAQ
jgi:N-sulfoglucosamine sulfohydrolase